MNDAGAEATNGGESVAVIQLGFCVAKAVDGFEQFVVLKAQLVMATFGLAAGQKFADANAVVLEARCHENDAIEDNEGKVGKVHDGHIIAFVVHHVGQRCCEVDDDDEGEGC
jgi:hypothetical protein